MKKLLAHRAVTLSLSFLPLVVFLRISYHYGYTDPGWMKGFLTGSALVLLIILAHAASRLRLRDLLFAAALLLLSGAVAFLADLTPMLTAYRRFQGSVFMLWYLLVRAAFAFAPRLISGFVYDPYAAVPVRAALLAAAVFAWSLIFSGIVVSIVLPLIVMTALLYHAEKDPAA